MILLPKKGSGWQKVILKCICISYNAFLAELEVCLFKLIAGSEAYGKLVDALSTTNITTAIKKASSNGQTSYLEGYHSVINQFAPKMLAYSYLGMLSRY